MKNKKVNKIMLSMGVLVGISVGMFTYQNFYLNKQNSDVLIFVAKDNIPAMTTVTNDMFKTVSIPQSGILPGYVTNINEIVGKELRGGLLKDEPLSKSRLIVNKDAKYDLEIKLESEISIPVSDNEYVNVYVSLTDSQGNVEVKKVFDTKQVSLKGAGVTITESADAYLTVRVTEDELSTYYNAKEKGKIIVVKNNSLDATEDITDNKYDPESQEAQNAIKPSENEEQGSAVSVIEKKVEEGETLDTLAIKYKTTAENIINLNNGKSDFKVGDNIVLPAN